MTRDIYFDIGNIVAPESLVEVNYLGYSESNSTD